jgi:hypothetical protein
MSFCTAISCIDGRIQLPVIDYLQNRFGVDYVDNVTEAGPVGILARDYESKDAVSIYKRIEISIEAHASIGIAIIAHHDCAGNSIPDSEQIQQIYKCLKILSKRFSQIEIVGLWLDKDWTIQEFTST